MRLGYFFAILVVGPSLISACSSGSSSSQVSTPTVDGGTDAPPSQEPDGGSSSDASPSQEENPGQDASSGADTAAEPTGDAATSASDSSLPDGRSISTRDSSSSSPGDTGTDAADDASVSPFVLSWEDDFNTFDSSAWQLETFTYGGNLAQFSTQNAAVANGILTISLTPNPSDTAEPYLGVEMRSTRTITYGKVAASMRFAKGSGVVSGLVLFYTPFPNCNWNEIDIEHLGDTSNSSQLNCQVYLGTPVPNCATSVTPTQDPLVTNLGLDAETAFHEYDIEWTPASVRFLVDGALLRTWTANIDLMTLPQTILLTIWASSSASWAGALTSSSAPTSAEVDWIKVYDWQH